MQPQPFHAEAGTLTKAEIIETQGKEINDLRFEVIEWQRKCINFEKKARTLEHDLNNERSTITLLLDLIEEIYCHGSSAQRDKSLKSILVTAGRIK